MNRVEIFKKGLKQSIDEMPVERLAVFLAVSGDIDSKMAQIGLEAFKEFESEIIQAKGNAGIAELDASGHYVDVFTKWLAEDLNYLDQDTNHHSHGKISQKNIQLV